MLRLSLVSLFFSPQNWPSVAEMPRASHTIKLSIGKLFYFLLHGKTSLETEEFVVGAGLSSKFKIPITFFIYKEKFTKIIGFGLFWPCDISYSVPIESFFQTSLFPSLPPLKSCHPREFPLA